MRFHVPSCLLFLLLMGQSEPVVAEFRPLHKTLEPENPCLPGFSDLKFNRRFASYRNHAVRRTAFGISLGFGNYAGDVAEKAWVWPETRPAFGVFVRHHFSSRWALKAQVYTSNVGGTDARAGRAELRARGLKFSSHLLELSIAGEWYFLNISPLPHRDRHQGTVAPYLFVGVGGVMMHPQVEPVGLSAGNGLAYPMQESGLAETAVVLPFGGGIRIKIAENMALGLEGGWRPVLSDYLDGVSHNGNPAKNDWYYSALASLSLCF